MAHLRSEPIGIKGDLRAREKGEGGSPISMTPSKSLDSVMFKVKSQAFQCIFFLLVNS